MNDHREVSEKSGVWESILLPYLRGLTFDGEKGLFISRTAQEVESSLFIEVKAANPADPEEVSKLLADCKNSFEAYIAENQAYPPAVRFSQGACYGFGATVEEARAGMGCSKTLSDCGSKARGDVVKDKIALVTGGAQGFGEGIVRGLVEAGAYTYIADMNIAGAEKLADSLNTSAGREIACAVQVNVTDEASVEAMLAFVAEHTGGLDIFVSNAGVLRAGSVKEMSLKDFEFVTSVDYTGFFICTKFAARLLALQNSAGNNYLTDIITISSKSGLEGSNKNGAYAGAKFGTIGLTQSFALELVKDNIKVNAICPGNFLDGPLWSDPDRGLFVQYLQTGKVPGAKTLEDVRRFYESKVPLNRGCTTEDVLRAILYCVEQKYETGQAVPVTGGQVMLN